MYRYVILSLLVFSVVLQAQLRNEEEIKKRHVELIEQHNQLQYLEGAHVVLPTKVAPTSLFEIINAASFYCQLESHEVYSTAEITIDQTRKLHIRQNIELIDDYTTHTVDFTLEMDLESAFSCRMVINDNSHPTIINHDILRALGQITLPGIIDCTGPGVQCGPIIAKLANTLAQFVTALKEDSARLAK